MVRGLVLQVQVSAQPPRLTTRRDLRSRGTGCCSSKARTTRAGQGRGARTVAAQPGSSARGPPEPARTRPPGPQQHQRSTRWTRRLPDTTRRRPDNPRDPCTATPQVSYQECFHFAKYKKFGWRHLLLFWDCKTQFYQKHWPKIQKRNNRCWKPHDMNVKNWWFKFSPLVTKRERIKIGPSHFVSEKVAANTNKSPAHMFAILQHPNQAIQWKLCCFKTIVFAIGRIAVVLSPKWIFLCYLLMNRQKSLLTAQEKFQSGAGSHSITTVGNTLTGHWKFAC